MRIKIWAFIIFSFTAMFGAINVVQAETVKASQTAIVNTTISTFDNQYTATLMGFDLDITSRLKASSVKGNYELYFNADAFAGNITEVSHIKWNAQEQSVMPLVYTNKYSGFGKTGDKQLNFNWAKQTINDVKNNTSLAMNNKKNIQDNLSYQLQLRQDLMAGKKSFVYPVGESKKIKDVTFTIVSEEVLSTPLGNVKTVKVKRSHGQSDRYTYAWFAKNYQYLLVRLQQENHGIAYTMDISKASLNGKPIAHF